LKCECRTEMEINLLLKMEINLLLKVNLSLRTSPVFGVPSRTCIVLFCR
jgi:hypothetical protein